MSAYGGLFSSTGGTSIAEFSVDIVTRGMERTLDQLERLEEKLEAMDKKLEELAKGAPARERALTGFLDKWGNSFIFIAGAAAGALAAIVAASPMLTASMSEMRYAFEWMAFTLGEQLSPEFDNLSAKLMKTAEDFEKWFAGLPEAGREVVSDLAFVLGTAGMGAVIGAALGSVVPGVGTAAGAIAGAIIGGVAGAIEVDLASSLLDAIDLALSSPTLITDIQEAIGGLLVFTAEIAFAALELGTAIAGAIVSAIVTYMLGEDAGRFVIEATRGLIDEWRGAEFGITIGGPSPVIPEAARGDLFNPFDEFMKWLQSILGGQYGFEGVVSSPTMFMAGERGLPEMVSITPLTGGGGGGMGGGGTTIIYSPTIEISGSISAEVVPYLVGEIQDVLERERRNLFSGVRP